MEGKVTIAEAWAKIKELWKQTFGDAPMPAEGTTTPYNMKDGSKMKCAGVMKIGCAANIEGANGEEFTAPDGEHELFDGTVVSVANGLITDIKNGAGEPGENMKMEEEVQALKDQLTAFGAKFEAQAKELADFKTAAEAQKTASEANEKVLKETFEMVKKIAEQPADEPVKYDFTKKPEKAGMTQAMMDALGPIKINVKPREVK